MLGQLPEDARKRRTKDDILLRIFFLASILSHSPTPLRRIIFNLFSPFSLPPNLLSFFLSSFLSESPSVPLQPPNPAQETGEGGRGWRVRLFETIQIEAPPHPVTKARVAVGVVD